MSNFVILNVLLQPITVDERYLGACIPKDITDPTMNTAPYLGLTPNQLGYRGTFPCSIRYLAHVDDSFPLLIS